MATVTFSTRTVQLDRFPAAERVVAEFILNTTGHTNVSVFPKREAIVQPDDNGFVSIDLAPTVDMRPECWYTVRFEWFSAPHPITGDRNSLGWAEMPGRLRVPSSGGDLGQLMDTPAPPGAIMYDLQPPAPHVQNVIYIDNSGMKGGLWLPAGTVGI